LVIDILISVMQRFGTRLQKFEWYTR